MVDSNSDSEPPTTQATLTQTLQDSTTPRGESPIKRGYVDGNPAYFATPPSTIADEDDVNGIVYREVSVSDASTTLRFTPGDGNTTTRGGDTSFVTGFPLRIPDTVPEYMRADTLNWRRSGDAIVAEFTPRPPSGDLIETDTRHVRTTRVDGNETPVLTLPFIEELRDATYCDVSLGCDENSFRFYVEPTDTPPEIGGMIRGVDTGTPYVPLNEEMVDFLALEDAPVPVDIISDSDYNSRLAEQLDARRGTKVDFEFEGGFAYVDAPSPLSSVTQREGGETVDIQVSGDDGLVNVTISNEEATGPLAATVNDGTITLDGDFAELLKASLGDTLYLYVDQMGGLVIEGRQTTGTTLNTSSTEDVVAVTSGSQTLGDGLHAPVPQGLNDGRFDTETPVARVAWSTDETPFLVFPATDAGVRSTAITSASHRRGCHISTGDVVTELLFDDELTTVEIVWARVGDEVHARPVDEGEVGTADATESTDVECVASVDEEETVERAPDTPGTAAVDKNPSVDEGAPLHERLAAETGLTMSPDGVNHRLRIDAGDDNAVSLPSSAFDWFDLSAGDTLRLSVGTRDGYLAIRADPIPRSDSTPQVCTGRVLENSTLKLPIELVPALSLFDRAISWGIDDASSTLVGVLEPIATPDLHGDESTYVGEGEVFARASDAESRHYRVTCPTEAVNSVFNGDGDPSGVFVGYAVIDGEPRLTLFPVGEDDLDLMGAVAIRTHHRGGSYEATLPKNLAVATPLADGDDVAWTACDGVVVGTRR